MARMFGPFADVLAVSRPVLPPRWSAALRALASGTAGILFGGALVGAAALRLAPEPPVTPVLDTTGELAARIAAPLPAVEASAISVPTVAPVTAAAPEATRAPVETPVATAAPASPPPATAPPPPPAVQAVAYRSGSRSYAALTVGPGAELASPIAGRAEVRTYQLINGEIRTGANVPGLAYYPYVIVRSGDRVVTLRPGALGADSELLVRDGATVGVGTPLVRVIGGGPSSWRAFYDRTLQAQVVVSLTTGGGADLDAVALFR